jgi:hypothetical protein
MIIASQVSCGLTKVSSDTAIDPELGNVIKPELGNVIVPRHRDEFPWEHFLCKIVGPDSSSPT